MNRTAIAGVLFVAGLLSCAAGANAQARQEVKYNMVPPQLTVSYQRSYEDYQFLEHDGTLRRIELNGVAAEYAYRRFYPVEIISRATYAAAIHSVRSSLLPLPARAIHAILPIATILSSASLRGSRVRPLATCSTSIRAPEMDSL